MKLNLGCGAMHLMGYTNCDLAENFYRVTPDVACDIRTLPFEDESVERIEAIHVFEHFYFSEAFTVLREWKRVLRPDGILVMEMPDLDKVIRHIQSGVAPTEFALGALYGDCLDPGHPEQIHKWCWNGRTITTVLSHEGFQRIEVTDSRFHYPERDMRVTARKS